MPSKLPSPEPSKSVPNPPQHAVKSTTDTLPGPLNNGWATKRYPAYFGPMSATSVLNAANQDPKPGSRSITPSYRSSAADLRSQNSSPITSSSTTISQESELTSRGHTPPGSRNCAAELRAQNLPYHFVHTFPYSTFYSQNKVSNLQMINFSVSHVEMAHC